jgi:hypothetical protein
VNEISASLVDWGDTDRHRDLPAEAGATSSSLDSVLAAELSTAGLCAHFWQEPTAAMAAQANVNSHHALALLELAWSGGTCFHAATRTGAAILGTAMLLAESFRRRDAGEQR